MTDETRLAKLRAMMDKAQAVAGTPEADTFNEKIAELITKWGVDEAMLASTGHITDTVGKRDIELNNPYVMNKVELLNSVAQPLGCKTVAVSFRGNAGRKVVTLFGAESDMDRVEILFTSLLLQATTGMNRVSIPSWEHARTFRNSWLRGFSVSIYNRLKDANTKVVDATPGAGLVLFDKSKLVNSLMADTYSNIRTAKSREVKSFAGFNTGHAAGKQADVNNTRIGGPRTAIGS